MKLVQYIRKQKKFVESEINVEQVTWADVQNGDTVYIPGKQGDEDVVHGPHIVQDQAGRKLRNGVGKIFFQYTDELWRTK